MGKLYRRWTPDQEYLLPPSPRDWLPADHLASFVLDLVAELDLSSIQAVYQAKDPRGTQPWDPRLLAALWLYALCVGGYSSRRIERATHEDVAFRVLAAEAHPDHTRLSEFRRVHHAALAGLFCQVLRLCAAAGLVKLGNVALDGTKLPANASLHKAMSHQRMVQR
ncbi:MAG: transposase, partial [Fimbriimonadaceae bacterium]|nr:transposase [Fimbriimonadaceae bacterium]